MVHLNPYDMNVPGPTLPWKNVGQELATGNLNQNRIQGCDVFTFIYHKQFNQM